MQLVVCFFLLLWPTQTIQAWLTLLLTFSHSTTIKQHIKRYHPEYEGDTIEKDVLTDSDQDPDYQPEEPVAQPPVLGRPRLNTVARDPSQPKVRRTYYKGKRGRRGRGRGGSRGGGKVMPVVAHRGGRRKVYTEKKLSV